MLLVKLVSLIIIAQIHVILAFMTAMSAKMLLLVRLVTQQRTSEYSQAQGVSRLKDTTKIT